MQYIYIYLHYYNKYGAHTFDIVPSHGVRAAIHARAGTFVFCSLFALTKEKLKTK